MKAPSAFEWLLKEVERRDLWQHRSDPRARWRLSMELVWYEFWRDQFREIKYDPMEGTASVELTESDYQAAIAKLTQES